MLVLEEEWVVVVVLLVVLVLGRDLAGFEPLDFEPETLVAVILVHAAVESRLLAFEHQLVELLGLLEL